MFFRGVSAFLLKVLFCFKIFFSPAGFDLCNPVGTQRCWRQAGLRPYFHRRRGANSGHQGDQRCEAIMKHLSFRGRDGE